MQLNKPDLHLEFTWLKLRLTGGGGSHGLGNEATAECVGSCTSEGTSHGAVVNMSSASLRENPRALYLRILQPSG